MSRIVGAFSRKARLLALVAVLLSLTACQTVQTRQSGSTMAPPQATKPAPRQTLVVRGDIVPDEPAPAPARAAAAGRSRAAAIATAPSVSDPVAEVPAPASDPAATPEVAPLDAPASEEALTTPTAITPPASVDPQLDDAPVSSVGFKPQSLLKDPVAALQTTVGGMPLWLVVAFGLLAIISLAIGFSGPREAETRDEPAFA